MDVMMENDVILFLGEKGGRFMKKFISLLVAAALCAGSSVAVFGADIPEGWHAVSDEELGLPSEEEERAITAALRSKNKSGNDNKIKYGEEKQESIYGSSNEGPQESYEEKLRKIMEEYGFMWVDEELDINCANGDVDELTEYFANNIEGFDPEKFEITLINNYADGANLYNILYQLIINGFETPYSISVSVEDDKEISYRVFFDEKDIEKLKSTPLKFTEYGFEEEIEKAKKEAAKAVPDDAVMEGQEVTKKLDENLKPYLYIETSCKDEYGGVFLLTYKCDLDADDIEG